MAAKRRRKSQGDATPADGAEGTEAGEGAGSEAVAEQAGAEEPSAETEASAIGTSGAAAEASEAPARQTPAVMRAEENTPARSVRELGRHTAASYEQSRDAAADFVETARERIREQPVQSLLIAAGVGVLIGIIWR